MQFAKEQPKNIEAETAFLHLILWNGEDKHEAMDILSTDDFYSPENKKVYEKTLLLKEIGEDVSELGLLTRFPEIHDSVIDILIYKYFVESSKTLEFAQKIKKASDFKHGEYADKLYFRFLWPPFWIFKRPARSS